MDTNEKGRAADDGMGTLYAFVCYATLALMALMEQFGDLPRAAAAFASGWYILRVDSCPERGGGKKNR